MNTNDLRRAATSPERDIRTARALPIPDRDEAERLFAVGAAAALESLLEDGLLGGRRVITEIGPPAPIAVTALSFEPFVRRRIWAQSEANSLTDILPDPRVRVSMKLYWERVPFRVVNSREVDVPAPTFGAASLPSDSGYRFVFSEQTYFILSARPVAGTNSLRFELGSPVEIPEGFEGVASVHGGALRCLTRLESARVGDSEFETSTRGKGYGGPLYRAEAVGIGSSDTVVHVVASSGSGSVETRVPLSTVFEPPPLPRGASIERRVSEPLSLPAGSRLLRTDVHGFLRADLLYAPGAAIVGVLVQPLPMTGAKGIESQQQPLHYVSLDASDVQWQLGLLPATAAAQPLSTRTLTLDLGLFLSSRPQSFLVSFVDEMARASEPALLSVDESFTVYTISPEIKEEFARVSEVAVLPLWIDIERIAAKFVQEADDLIRAAESRLESTSPGQPSVQQSQTTP